MTMYEFIASVVGSIAWPAAAVALAFVFREDVKQLLARLLKLRALGGEAEFGSVLEGAERAAASGGLAETASSPEAEEVVRMADLLLEPPAPQPAVAVYHAWAEVEKALAAAVERRGMISAGFTPINEARRLRGVGTISAEVLEVIERLHELRNRAAHFQKPGGVTAEEVREYARLAGRVVGALNSLDGPSLNLLAESG